MEFGKVFELAVQYWWAWGIASIVLGGFVLISQARRNRRMMKSISRPLSRDFSSPFNSRFDAFEKDFDEAVDTATKGMGVTVAAAILEWLCGIMFLITTVVSALRYFNVLQ